VFSVLIEDLPLGLIQGQSFKRKDRPYHVFAHPLGLFFGLSSDLAVHVKSCMTPVKNLLDKVFIDQVFTKEKREDFKCEKLTKQGIVKMRDPVKLPFFIWASFCDQKVEVRMKVYPATEWLDHRNDARVEIFFCSYL